MVVEVEVEVEVKVEVESNLGAPLSQPLLVGVAGAPWVAGGHRAPAPGPPPPLPVSPPPRC